MYKRFYGFSRTPFDLNPDPERVFMSWTHKEGLAVLEYGVMSKKGFLVLTGDVGTGKTTLLQSLVSTLEDNVHVCLLNNPTLSRDEFLSYLAHTYNLPWEGNKALFLVELAKFFRECGTNNERVLLIIDEAHVIPVSQMEEIRLLSNQDPTGGAVFSIFFVGQPELDIRLQDERLLPLRQRIGLRFRIERFSRDITVQYIIFRLRMAGAKNLDIFSENALTLIHDVSKGIPRLINLICDHALLTGFADANPVINTAVIRECVRDLRLFMDDESFPSEIKSPSETTAPSNSMKKVFLTGSIMVAVLFVLLLLEVLPGTRAYSPLGMILPGQWLDSLHHLITNGG